jgi:hypothetical protein
MRGQDPIVAMRRTGRRPETLYLSLRDFPHGAPTWAIPEHTVFVEDCESIARLDLRFLVDCNVSIDGSESTRVRRLFDAAKSHGAGRVLAHVAVPAARETFQLLEILDTDGVMTWLKS